MANPAFEKPRIARVPRTVAAFLLFLAWSAALTASAGTERYGDVTVSVGDATGPATYRGYVSLPVTIRNDGPRPRRVSIRVPERSYGGGEDHLDSLRRGFDVGAGGTVTSELLLPPLPARGNGAAAVSIDGVTQRDAVSVNLNTGGYDAGPAGFLVSRGIDLGTKARLEAAVDTHNGGPSSAGSSGGYGGGFGGGYGGPANEVPLTAAEPVEQWSRSWLGHTGFSAVLVDEDDLARMPVGVATALRGYVFSGGQLVVLTDRAGTTPVPRSWPATDASGTVGLGRVAWWGPDQPERTDDAAAVAWIRSTIAFANASNQPLDAQAAEDGFPVVEGLSTPVRGLVLLMLLFTVLIGPVNILLLWYFKRRMWLLWTVPLGSAVFSLGVVAFAFLSEGISPKARTQAVTYLDQTTREAVTIGMRGYYAPLTPGDGLRFPMSTRIVPQVSRRGWGDGGRGRSVDQTSGQHLTRGWVAARVPAHLELTDVAESRLRLDVEELPGGGVAVTNGFGVDLEDLVLIGSDAKRYAADRVAAGARIELTQDGPDAGPGLPEADIRAFGWNLPANGVDVNNLNRGYYTARLADETPFLADGLEGLREHRVDAAVIGRYRVLDRRRGGGE